MGLFDFLTGNADPDPSKPRLPRDELYQRLLALRDPGGRWSVRAAQGDGRADLVAEWRAVDQVMQDEVRVAGRKAASRVLLRLVEEDAMVRSVDQDGALVWEVETGHAAFEAEGFRGQKRQIGGTWTFGRKEDGSVGKTAETRFDTDDIKRPLRQAVADAGWGWHGVAMARL